MNSDISGLTAGTIYYVRAFATNAVGTSYGGSISFTTDPPTSPSVTTGMFYTTSSLSGTLTCSGGLTTSVGFQYNTTGNFSAGVSTITSSLMGNGIDFSGAITGTVSGTTYYIRAYATNSLGTMYGSTVSITATSRTPLAGSNGNSDYGSTDNQRGESISPMNNSTSLLSENADKNLIAVSRKKKMLAISVNSASPPENIY
jgi:hypothetical protein